MFQPLLLLSVIEIYAAIGGSDVCPDSQILHDNLEMDKTYKNF
jgi:hypothetical protein